MCHRRRPHDTCRPISSRISLAIGRLELLERDRMTVTIRAAEALRAKQDVQFAACRRQITHLARRIIPIEFANRTPTLSAGDRSQRAFDLDQQILLAYETGRYDRYI